METVVRKIDSIIPYENNAKIHTTSQIKSVARSIQEFGYVQPIVIDEAGVIIIGHCRFEAIKLLGKEEVECVIATGLTSEQVNALRLIDNKTNESDWDMTLLNEELRELTDTFDMENLGFSVLDLISLNSYEPDELALEDEETYSNNAEEQLLSTRVILHYDTEDEEDWLRQVLEADNDLGVVVYVRNLMEE